LWNNEIGRQIGEYVRRNGLSQGDLEDLIKQSYDRTDGTGLIKSFNDPRIPSKATGWPGTFPLPGTRGAPNWGGPDSGWTPSRGPGIVGSPSEPFPPNPSFGRSHDLATQASDNKGDSLPLAATLDERRGAPDEQGPAAPNTNMGPMRSLAELGDGYRNAGFGNSSFGNFGDTGTGDFGDYGYGGLERYGIPVR
jgi:hypothetical protein